jgi:hypothetical protein
MPSRFVAVATVALVVLAVLTAGRAIARGGGVGMACKAGTVQATIHATPVCLRTGGRCATRYQRQYAKYGFSCRSGRLAKAVKTIPPPTSSGTTTTTNPNPAGPFLGTWYAIDPTDGSLEQATFGSDGSLLFRDDAATACGGVSAYATATGAARANVWTADAPTTLLCPDNQGSVGNHLFQFTLNANGTLSATGTPDVWTRESPR